MIKKVVENIINEIDQAQSSTHSAFKSPTGFSSNSSTTTMPHTEPLQSKSLQPEPQDQIQEHPELSKVKKYQSEVMTWKKANRREMDGVEILTSMYYSGLLNPRKIRLAGVIPPDPLASIRGVHEANDDDDDEYNQSKYIEPINANAGDPTGYTHNYNVSGIVRKITESFIAEPKEPLFIWGAPGVGKTAVVHQVGKTMGIPVIIFLLNQCAPEDIIGLPYPSTVKYEGAGDIKTGPGNDPIKDYWKSGEQATFNYRIPYYFPLTNGKQGKGGIIFFDEFNTAKKQTMVAALTFLSGRCTNGYSPDIEGFGYKIPDKWRLCAAGNREGENLEIVKMEAAMGRRFSHHTLVPTIKAYAEHQYSKRGTELEDHIYDDIIAFLWYKPEFLHNMDHLSDERKANYSFPNPAGWETVSNLLNKIQRNRKESGQRPLARQEILEYVQSKVGGNAAIHFGTFLILKGFFGPEEIDKILNKPMEATLPPLEGYFYEGEKEKVKKSLSSHLGIDDFSAVKEEEAQSTEQEHDMERKNRSNSLVSAKKINEKYEGGKVIPRGVVFKDVDSMKKFFKQQNWPFPGVGELSYREDILSLVANEITIKLRDFMESNIGFEHKVQYVINVVKYITKLESSIASVAFWGRILCMCRDQIKSMLNNYEPQHKDKADELSNTLCIFAEKNHLTGEDDENAMSIYQQAKNRQQEQQQPAPKNQKTNHPPKQEGSIENMVDLLKLWESVNDDV